ncbi:MAG: membrane-bound PQQ-dependent dehydrogenase, glucose/quinate/shikimate family [Amaricoccus sp.]
MGVAAALFGGVLILVGLGLGLPGAYLVALGGSWYYLLAGLALVVSGWLYIRRRVAGAWLYGLTCAATLAWALWEAGPGFWPLVPRLVAPAVLAIPAVLLVPALTGGAGQRGARLAAIGLAAGLAATGWLMVEPHGVIRTAWTGGTRAPMPATETAGSDWRHYGRTPNGTRYAPFAELTPATVGGLAPAWSFRYGDAPSGAAQDQNTLLFVGDTLYACSPHNIVHALDAETGALRWRFDPQASAPTRQRCRGLGYHEAAEGECPRRLLLTTIDARLIAIDARTGRPCAGFGAGGTVDLKTGLGEVRPGFYFPTSAPTVMRDLVMVGGWVWDGMSTGEPSGVVRAFDARTGALAWAWDLGNPATTALPPPGETYTRGTPNVWSTPAFDDALGLVYLPTGNATPDFWGGHRTAADDAYNSSIVALDIATGRERWRFRTVNHDIWDYDVPSQPALYDLPDGAGGTIPALIQVTKRGRIFLLDRRDGRPLTPIEQRAVPTDAAEGDRLAPTQPYPTGMPDIGTAPLSEARMWGATPFDQLYCRIKFRRLRYDGDFTPLTTRRALMFPGYFGGMNWGSVAIDEGRGLMIVNDTRIAQIMQLIPRGEIDAAGLWHGRRLTPQEGTPFAALKEDFVSPLGIPCQQPPYGTLSAIDLATRQIVWQVPGGTLRDLWRVGPISGPAIPIGLPTLGGPVATAGGLVFHAGTQDNALRAYDVTDGREAWSGRLPVGAMATPTVYVSPVSGRQFVVVSAGGLSDASGRGDYILAFARPKG